MSCIFCKIINGGIPSHKIYEDEDTIAFLDAYPAGAGHTLILPKAHYADVMNTPDAIFNKTMSTAKKLAPVITKAMDADGFNLFLNNGRAAGQVVDHVHLHILPRNTQDNLKIGLPQKPYGQGEAEKIKQSIINCLRENHLDREKIKEQIKQNAPQGKISCAKAFELAQLYGISHARMGESLNQLKIKIVKCQLGCF